MIQVYECEFCGIGVEFNTDDLQEHNEFDCCLDCYYKESDTGEVY